MLSVFISKPQMMLCGVYVGHSTEIWLIIGHLNTSICRYFTSNMSVETTPVFYISRSMKIQKLLERALLIVIT